MVKIAPSVLAADFACLERSIARVGDADWLHVDVMDGRFVPNLTFGAPIVAALRRISPLPLDVHLMVDEPDPLLPALVEAGADRLTVHAEACRHLHRTLQRIQELGVKAGVALNPATNAEAVEYVLPLVDLVLVMTVNPGFGGQAFLPGVLTKISDLAGRGAAAGRELWIEVDGGITPETAGEAVAAGANVLVAGTAVFGARDPGLACRRLREAAARPVDRAIAKERQA